ncbi:hypothetical protein HY630_03795 [Candidatus Uhrbacteria bacterium]|nr:hypothetical protein [Candidatus Uhrbacteria bacterium]
MPQHDQATRAVTAQRPVVEGLGEKKKKPNGYYKDWENCQRELHGAIDRLEHFPTKTELEVLGLGSLATSVISYHGGMRTAALKMGCTPAKPTQDGYWKSWNNCEAQLRKLRKTLRHFPTDREMRDLGQSGFLSALADYHGGLTGARTRMNVRPPARPKQKSRPRRPSKSRSNRSWQAWKNVEREFKIVIRTLGHFPTQKELAALKQSSLAFAAWKYHGGLYAVRERLGLHDETAERPKGYWKEWDHIEPILRTLTTTLGHFPSHSEIDTAGHVSAGDAIRKYHGGMNAARKRMEAPQQTKHGHWLVWKNCEAKLRELMAEIGKFPSGKWLAANKHGGLADAINKRHGGFLKVRARLGHVRDVKPDGYWQVWKNVEKELRDVVRSLGHFPNPQELRRLGLNSLSHAMSEHHGGFIVTRKRLGYERASTGFLARYADSIADAYLQTSGKTSFDEYVTELERECPYERDLRVRLGLPPEPDLT